jgi:hypothetical protein
MTTPTSIQIEDGSVEQRKEYFIKIFAQNGSYIGTFDDIGFTTFSKTINGGLGQLNLDVARPLDDFKEGDEIAFGNEIQLWIVDKESGSDGQKIYSGLIDMYEPYATRSEEGVKVRCVGYATRLGQVLYKDGTTVNITQNSTDPSDMVKNVIDKFRGALPASEDARINYTGSSIESTGESASYTFVLKDCRSALEKARSFAPFNWFFYIGADNVVKFQSKPDEVTHTFTFRRDVGSIRIRKGIRNLVNQAVLYNGKTGVDALLRSYDNDSSVEEYGLRMGKKTDSRWGNTDTMDLVGNSYVNTMKDPNVRVTLEIIDSNQNELGYDIESINPGDTCRILNLPDSFTVLEDDMTITSVRYQLGKVQLQLEELRQTLVQKVADIMGEQQRQSYSSNDVSDYTEV